MVFYSRDADGPINAFLMKLEQEGKKVTNMVVTQYTTGTSDSFSGDGYPQKVGRQTINTAVIFVS
jgi:hypothetical protein